MKVLEFINRLSLDAPIVVLMWQEIISLDLNVVPTLNQKLVLFLAIWLAYSVDRYLECFGKRSGENLHDRHFFYFKHRNVFLFGWIIILISSLLLSIKCFSNFQILTGLTLVMLAILNQILTYFEPFAKGKIFSKKQRTSFLLSCACVYLPLVNGSGIVTDVLTISVFLYLLFWLNCTYISFLENEVNPAKFDLVDYLSFDNERKRLFCKCVLFFAAIFCFILFSSKTFFCITSITTLLAFFYINNTSMNRDSKRIVLDQCFWIIPTILTIINNVQ